MIGGLKRRVQSYLSDRRLAAGLRHVSGPHVVALGADDTGVVVLARNAEWYLKDCIDHHLGLGARHVVVIDAGSTDQTAAIASAHADVTLLATTLPLVTFESALRTAAARRVLQGGWVLFADPDEMAEPPVPLPQLVAYANTAGYTAILGQILDMVPTIGAGVRASYADARATGSTFTTFGLESVPYGDPSFHLDWFTRANHVPDPGVRMLAGGMRKLVFGQDPVLSKHVLVRNRPDIELMSHPHCAGNVTLADITIAVRRYMFAGDWQARDRATVAAGTWAHGEDAQRLNVAGAVGWELRVPQPQAWTGTEAVLEQGFLYASDAARKALRPARP